MSNSRLSGDLFEYIIANYFIQNGLTLVEEKSILKFNKLKEKISVVKNNFTNNDIEKIFNIIKIDKYKNFRFTQDNDGKIGNVSDIELYNDDKNNIGISCKVNNISIKHQRPSSLCKQCNLTDKNIDKYNDEYKKCNDKWYNLIKDKITFDKIDKDDKNNLYKEFNELVKKYLDILNDEQIKYFYKFLINYNNIYVLYHDTKKNQIIIYNYIKLKEPTKIKSIELKDNRIIINFNNDINIDMRLHNASKSITKALSLKYDAKILNSEKIFTTTTNDLDNKSKLNLNKKNLTVLSCRGGISRGI
jgi:hypothetical protein